MRLKKLRFKDDPINMEFFMKFYGLELSEKHTVKTDDPDTIKKLEAIEGLVKAYDEVFDMIHGKTNQHLKNSFAELGYIRGTGYFNTVVVPDTENE
jgi:hypothetical protein